MHHFKRAFLCDDFTEGQYCKADIRGYNSTGKLCIKHNGYMMITTLVVEGSVDAGSPSLRLEAHLIHSKRNGEVAFSEKRELDLPANKKEMESGLFICLPIDGLPVHEGIMALILQENGTPIFSSEFRVFIGDAPLVEVPVRMSYSGVVTTGDTTIVRNLLAMVRNELIIADQYLEPAFLFTLSPLIKNGARILLFVRPGPGTSAKYEEDYLSESARLKALPQKVEVRLSHAFHDRFVVINGTEFYHVGYSLKDLQKPGVTWRHSKITGLKEIDELRAQIDSEIKARSTLF